MSGAYYKELKRLARRFGRELDESGRNHYRLVCPRGDRPFVIANRSGVAKGRAWKNLIADLRRNDHRKGPRT